MISFLRGKVEAKETGSIVINVNDIGYLVHIPSTEKIILSQENQTIFTYLYVREDRVVLYGFLSLSERDFFKILIDTPGIGPKVAMNIIADIGPEQFQRAVLAEDLSSISSVSGIGIKLAKKIVLELKEKLKQFKLDYDLTGEEYAKRDIIYDGIEALKTLGYPEKDAKHRIIMALKKTKHQKGMTIEDLIKNALNKTKD